jgi:hypothetical protein
MIQPASTTETDFDTQFDSVSHLLSRNTTAGELGKRRIKGPHACLAHPSSSRCKQVELLFPLTWYINPGHYPKKRSQKCRDDHVALVASVTKLRLILASSYFDVAQAAVDEVADLLTQAGIDPKGRGEAKVDLQKVSPVLAIMLAHFLVLAIPWETRRGRFATSADYLAYLHELMDQSEAINGECEAGIGLLTVSCVC